MGDKRKSTADFKAIITVPDNFLPRIFKGKHIHGDDLARPEFCPTDNIPAGPGALHQQQRFPDFFRYLLPQARRLSNGRPRAPKQKPGW